MAEAAEPEPIPDEPQCREDYVRIAKELDIDEKYDELVDLMKQLACTKDVKMTVEERSLLAVGYKNVVGIRIASWRIMTNIEAKEIQRGDQEKLEMVRTYKSKIAKELSDICNDLFQLLAKTLIPAAEKADDNESKVFYHKMEAEYTRYMSECALDQKTKESYRNASKSLYEKVTDLAKQTLEPPNPVRLGVALCYSMFINEVEEAYEDAYKHALDCFEEAIVCLDTLPDETYKDSTHIMQLIRDNLVEWKRDARDREKPFMDKDDIVDDEFDGYTESESSTCDETSTDSSSFSSFSSYDYD